MKVIFFFLVAIALKVVFQSRNLPPDYISDMEYMETKVFKVNGIDVKFEFSDIPNDMKMLSFLGGELSNSATYFSSFGSVTYAYMNSLEFTFGRAESNHGPVKSDCK